jgi:hypothetical protein
VSIYNVKKFSGGFYPQGQRSNGGEREEGGDRKEEGKERKRRQQNKGQETAILYPRKKK